MKRVCKSTLTWIEKLTIAKKSGFDYLEISIDESDAKLAKIGSANG